MRPKKKTDWEYIIIASFVGFALVIGSRIPEKREPVETERIGNNVT